MVAEFRRRRDLVYKMLNDIPGIKANLPDGAFYFFFDVSAFFGKVYQGTTISTAEDMSGYLLREGKNRTRQRRGIRR
jgi:aspartate aminotransferase